MAGSFPSPDMGGHERIGNDRETSLHKFAHLVDHVNIGTKSDNASRGDMNDVRQFRHDCKECLGSLRYICKESKLYRWSLVPLVYRGEWPVQ